MRCLPRLNLLSCTLLSLFLLMAFSGGPTFYTLPEHKNFIPSVSHPGEDAGADIRACLSIDGEYLSLDASIRSIEYSQKIFVDGEEVFNGRDAFKESSVISAIQKRKYFVLPPGETVVVNSGFKISFPDFSFYDDKLFPWTSFVPYYQIVSRSGLAINHGIVVRNAPGIIDSGYHGWVKVALTNTRNHYHVFTEGARIAQGIYSLAYNQHLAASTTDPYVFQPSLREAGGFGSTSLT